MKCIKDSLQVSLAVLHIQNVCLWRARTQMCILKPRPHVIHRISNQWNVYNDLKYYIFLR